VNPCKPQLRCHTSEYINYCLKIKVAITLRCQLCSTCYQQVQIEKYLKSNCVIKVASMKYTKTFLLQRGVQPPNWHFSLSADEWNTKEGTCKSTKNVLCICTVVCQKAPLRLKRHRTVNIIQQWKGTWFLQCSTSLHPETCLFANRSMQPLSSPLLHRCWFAMETSWIESEDHLNYVFHSSWIIIIHICN